MLYIALIADLIGSRQLKDRAGVQQLLRTTLDDLNESFADQIASHFTITLGDEFQGLLHPGAGVFFLLDRLEAALHPYPLRFGLGLGRMATPIDPAQSIGADGEAFWRARAALTFVHNHDDYGAVRTRFDGLSRSEDDLINGVLALTDALKRRWSDVQRETFAALLAAGIYDASFDQKRMAERLGISQDALYRRLKLGSIKLYMRSRRAAQQFIVEAAGRHD